VTGVTLKSDNEQLSEAIYERLTSGGSALTFPLYYRRAPKGTKASDSGYIVYRLSWARRGRSALMRLASISFDVFGYGDATPAETELAKIDANLAMWRARDASGGVSTFFEQELAEPVDDPDDVRLVHLTAVYNTEWASSITAESGRES